MLLYLYPGACSLADHIALIETKLPYRLATIDRDKRTADGRDFLSINPRGFVPALELDDGTVLTENLAILTYLAQTSGRLLAEAGIDRWRALEATSFIATEIHGNFKPLFRPDSSEPEKDKARRELVKHFTTLDDQLGEKPFLLGDRMTIADPYLFVWLRWASKMGIDLPTRLSAYLTRMRELPSVARALAEEGIA